MRRNLGCNCHRCHRERQCYRKTGRAQGGSPVSTVQLMALVTGVCTSMYVLPIRTISPGRDVKSEPE